MNGLIYSGLKAILFVFSRLPLRAGYLLSTPLYVLLCHIAGYRKKVIYANLRLVFPEKSRRELSAIVKKFYRHLSDVFVELTYSLYISGKEIDRRVRFVNPELIDKYYAEGRHIVGVTGHYANWEWCYKFQSQTAHSIMEIYKKMSSKTFDRLLYDMRSRFGGKPVEMANLKQVFFESKRNPVFVYLVADQSPAIMENSWYYTSFLGVDGTPIFTGPEKIARKLNAVFVYIDMQKLRRGFYQVEFIVLSDRIQETPENHVLDLYLAKMEEIIRKKPEYWFWSHRRWKRRKITQ